MPMTSVVIGIFGSLSDLKATQHKAHGINIKLLIANSLY